MGDRATTLSGDAVLVREQADAVLAAEALGRSHALERLFRFLLTCTLEGRSPKELEIADEVFGRSAASIDQDASIRVHIHRLRRKLDEYYLGAGASQPVRLVIPKADYRLAIEPQTIPPIPTVPSKGRLSRWSIVGFAAALAMLSGAIGWWLGNRPSEIDATLAQVRGSPLWSPVVTNARRVAIVVGDYYIFGERDERGDVTRLVREFAVNSPKDLERSTVGDPARNGRYVDLGLNYLPVGVGNAVRVISPILLTNGGGGVVPSFVVPASQLTPEMVKYTNLVYVGYLSGLGSLRDPLFAGSRFEVGGSYDEIVDRSSGRSYNASTPMDREAESPGQDYAIVSSFRGVTGNVIVVIAGTRDAGLMQAAEYVARPETLAQLAKVQSGGSGFEALLAIESLENVGLRARLIAAAPRNAEADWSGRQTQTFPDSAQPDRTSLTSER